MKKENKFRLTESQQVLKDKLTTFLDSPERLFLITGKPGVGKTTMTKIGLEKHIDADIESQATGQNVNVAGITLAHKAKNVLGEHIPNVFTFATAYGMKEVFHNDGSRTFEYDKYNEDVPVGHCSIPVFVHDEVSQYTQEMLDIVLEKTPIFSKIIFMGDVAQLPPIDPDRKMKRDADSPVFELELPEECKHELTERVRQQEGNPILDLSDIIREEILGSKNIRRVLEEMNKPKMVDGVGFDFIYYSNLNEHLEEKGVDKSAVIAFKNTTIDWFNQDIRNYILDNPEEMFVEGDLVCMRDNFYRKDRSGSIMYKLFNSDIYRLSRVYKKDFKFSDSNKHHSVPVYMSQVKGDKYKELILPTEKGILKLNKILERLHKECKIGKNSWDNYWEIRKKFCNCSYGYAITAYKCQGSTYNTVYVDVNDVLLTKPLTTKRKLQTIYTAITRAKFDVYFLKSRTIKKQKIEE